MAHSRNGISLSHKKTHHPNLTICDKMDGPREYYAQSNKSDRETQIPYDFTYRQNPFLKKDRNTVLAGVAQWIESSLQTKGSPGRFPVRAHTWVAPSAFLSPLQTALWDAGWLWAPCRADFALFQRPQAGGTRCIRQHLGAGRSGSILKGLHFLKFYSLHFLHVIIYFAL